MQSRRSFWARPLFAALLITFAFAQPLFAATAAEVHAVAQAFFQKHAPSGVLDFRDTVTGETRKIALPAAPVRVYQAAAFFVALYDAQDAAGQPAALDFFISNPDMKVVLIHVGNRAIAENLSAQGKITPMP